MSFKSWEKPQGFLPPGQYELDPTHPINQDGPPLGAWYAANLPGGPTLVDLSRNGNHGTLQGGVDWVAGRDGPVLDIPGSSDGSGGSIEIPYSGPPLTGAATWLFDYKLTSAPAGKGIFTKNFNKEFDIFRVNSNNKIRFHHGDGSFEAVDSNSAAVVGTRQQWAVVRTTQPKEIIFYLNGNLDAVRSYTKTIISGTDPIELGARGNLQEDCEIGYAVIYDRALPAPDIRTLHADPHALLRPVRRWWAVTDVGITHPVIGSGIINSEAIIGGSP